MTDEVKVERAILSVSDKTGLPGFAKGLNESGVQLLATGGTFSSLKDAGISVGSLSDEMSVTESFSGRVKTLHSSVFAAILAERTPEGLRELASMGVKPIDMVVCNFYPFEAASSEPGSDDHALVEKVDIGGPSMVRAAAKNHRYVAVVPSVNDYGTVLAELRRSGGKISLKTRQFLALEAFSITAAYDALIYGRLAASWEPQSLPNRLVLSATKFKEAKYGENPGQRAQVYRVDGYGSMASWKQLAGETPSYNNYLDIGSAFDILEGFEGVLAAATVKHGQISGFAFSVNIAEAYRLAHACDPEADFGGTVIFNREVETAAAKLVGKNEGAEDGSVYTEIVIAPGFSPEALTILEAKQKKKMRLIQTTVRPDYPYDVKLVEGAVLLQDPQDYRRKLEAGHLTVPTKVKPDQVVLAKLLAAWEVVRRVQSNGIVIANGEGDGPELRRFWTLGVASFRKRNGAVRIALENAGDRARGSVCASDGFFPFRDSIDLLGGAGVSAVIQPGGSINDAASIEAANEHGMSMVLTHTRAFKH